MPANRSRQIGILRARSKKESSHNDEICFRRRTVIIYNLIIIHILFFYQYNGMSTKFSLVGARKMIDIKNVTFDDDNDADLDQAEDNELQINYRAHSDKSTKNKVNKPSSVTNSQVKFDDADTQDNNANLDDDQEDDDDYLEVDEDELDRESEQFYSKNPIDQQATIQMLNRDLNRDDLKKQSGNFHHGLSGRIYQIPYSYQNQQQHQRKQRDLINKFYGRSKTSLTGYPRRLNRLGDNYVNHRGYGRRNKIYSNKSPLNNFELSPKSSQQEQREFIGKKQPFEDINLMESSGHSKNRFIQSGTEIARRQQMGSNCALYLARNGLNNCITFDDVEDAAQRARQRLNFRISSAQLRSPEPSEATINTVGQLIELTTRNLARRFALSWPEVAFELDQIDIRRTTLWADCPIIYRVSPLCTTMNRYRTHTGLCNNLIATTLGSTMMPFLRMLPGDYGDGVGEPRLSSRSRLPLPPARMVVLALHPNIESPSMEHSNLLMSWGQLINHDVAMASGAREGTGHGEACCPNLNIRGVCMPIELGENDPVYSEYGLTCHEFKRSISGLRPGCSLGPRTQTNTITSFIDVSFVYGSSKSMTNSLRQTQRGLLSMWNIFRSEGFKPMLPAQRENPDSDCIGRSPRQGRAYCFKSGDVRTNQHVQLVALHTIHARQHNRLAQALGQMNPHWTNNRIYHEARHIHIAMVQHILLTEYLPIILGSKSIKKFNLTEAPMGSYWDYYEPSRNPGVSQAFAAAAFRQGHTRVPSQVYRVSQDHRPIRAYQLRELFRQPWPLFEPGAMDEFLLGMLDAPAASYDPFMSLELSGHLLQMPDEPIGLDLASINIQRGRDQGVPGYNAYRDWCGLGRVNNFEDLLGSMNSQSIAAMAQLYECVDDIDLFSGGVSEFPISDGQVGPTFACIIGKQFETLRAGDRFWFETSMGPNAFTMDQLNSIKQVSLAQLICANSDNIVTLQQQALLLPHPIYNPRQFCASMPDLDISLWFDPPGGPIINPASGR